MRNVMNAVTDALGEERDGIAIFYAAGVAFVEENRDRLHKIHGEDWQRFYDLDEEAARLRNFLAKMKKKIRARAALCA